MTSGAAGHPGNAPRIQSVARVAAILDALDAAPPPEGLALAALAAAVKLHRSTAFTLVRSLVDAGLVDQDGAGGRYRLGLGLLVYGRTVERRLDIAARARPGLMRLATATGETVNLALPRARDAVIVDSLEGTRGVRVTAYAGTPAAYHSTACGRALLAHQPGAVIEEILAAPLPRVTERTMTDPGALREALREARARGFALEEGENEPDASCLAAPILGPDGCAVAAISIAAPATRMTRDAVARIEPVLHAETEALGVGRLRGRAA